MFAALFRRARNAASEIAKASTAAANLSVVALAGAFGGASGIAVAYIASHLVNGVSFPEAALVFFPVGLFGGALFGRWPDRSQAGLSIERYKEQRAALLETIDALKRRKAPTLQIERAYAALDALTLQLVERPGSKVARDGKLDPLVLPPPPRPTTNNEPNREE